MNWVGPKLTGPEVFGPLKMCGPEKRVRLDLGINSKSSLVEVVGLESENFPLHFGELVKVPAASPVTYKRKIRRLLGSRNKKPRSEKQGEVPPSLNKIKSSMS